MGDGCAAREHGMECRVQLDAGCRRHLPGRDATNSSDRAGDSIPRARAGAQGGDVAAVVLAGLDARGKGLLISSSRAILFSEILRPRREILRDEINAARKASHAAR